MFNAEQSPQGERKDRPYQEGDFVPTEIQYLETPAGYKAQASGGEGFDMAKHLDRLANDQRYFEDYFRGQMFGVIENFYITKKEGAYTLTSPDIMLMLARASKRTPEAHLHELRAQDLMHGVKLCEDFREEMIARGYAPKDVYIGLAGGECASIKKLHWHIYATDEYKTIPTAEGVQMQKKLHEKLGWTSEQSAANHQLVAMLQEAGISANYDHFSALIKLDGELSDDRNLEILSQLTAIAQKTGEDIFGKESGYSLTIRNDNTCNLRITRGKQGIVESENKYLFRNSQLKRIPEDEAKKDRLLAAVIHKVLVNNWDSKEEDLL